MSGSGYRLKLLKAKAADVTDEISITKHTSSHQREERDHPVIRSKMFPQTPAVYFTAKLSSFLRVEEIFKHCHLIYM